MKRRVPHHSGLFLTALVALSGLSGLSGSQALAATVTNTFNVTANVSSECAVSAATLAFGTYSITASSPDDATSTITVTCTNGTDWDVSLNGGGTGLILARLMSGTGNPLNLLGYQLYTSAGRTTVWGDGLLGSQVSGTGTGSAQSLTVYGRIPAGQAVASDSYTDTVTVAVTY
ncbi:MAG: spore coat U domain-containing protein [Pseudomonadota bacterium]|nr:spore coat U domain-containing protein [Pseudomonadota bacterium]